MRHLTTPDRTRPHAAGLREDLPSSFGAFKPAGWLMVGLPTQNLARRLLTALREAGWPGDGIRDFSARESHAELEAMVGNAGSLAGFGDENTLLRRPVTLAKDGHQWLLVKVDGSKQAALAAELARSAGATLAVHYRTLMVEDMF